MDTAVLLVKRREIQARMEQRRIRASLTQEAAPSNVWSWVLKAGSGLLGVTSAVSSKSLGSSLLWSVLAPMVLGSLRGSRIGWVQKILHMVLPNSRES